MDSFKSVFLIDDDTDDQESFVQALDRIDCVTLYGIANNGVEAIEHLERSTVLPYVMFMDINMPLMNGFECLTRLRTDNRFKDIPVVILSTSSDQTEKAHRLGATAFIKKPADETKLQLQLEQLMKLNLNVESESAEKTFDTPA